MADFESNDRDGVYSQRIRAGKRTYFFDVKVTRSEDYYVTITESKRVTGHDGNAAYQKHKIFLYKEDFYKFLSALQETLEHVREEYFDGVSLEELEIEAADNQEDW